MSNKIRTYTGIDINPFEPSREQIHIEDIAHALSNECRWNGHCHTFYSVAQHCVIGAKALLAIGETLAAKTFLLHDASEAYLKDLPSPVKEQLPGYKEAEFKLQETIYMALTGHEEYEIADIVKAHKLVKEYDLHLRETEWQEVMLSNRGICWTPNVAKAEFLKMYSKLFL
jgi:5'-deoxynucleotidase YfbR-like HD superfamily hydrolase